MSTPKKIVCEGKELGETDTPKATGEELSLRSGSQDGFETYKAYQVEKVTEDKIIVSEKPLLD